MDVSRQFRIGVAGGSSGSPPNHLFSALASIFPVEFRPLTDGDCHGLDALILIGLDPERIRSAAVSGLPAFAAADPSSTPPPDGPAEFRLGQSEAISACLRGHRFEEHRLSAITLPPIPGDVVLASEDGRPTWLRRCVDGADVTMVRWQLPHLTPNDHIHENFHSTRCLRLLPLLQFIRNLTDQADWQSPSIPACLLIDDPNLHRTTYGYLDFSRLAADAAEQQFYVSVATVPLDSWWINSQTRDLFRENAQRLSVLIHGNNHTHEELAHPAPHQEMLALLAQALRRFDRLEQSGMNVCRVMECPHGALSLAMLEPMARLGYEAVFASTAHLLRCNEGSAFRSSLGAECTLLERNVVPVIPRIPVSTGWQTEVRLAAFLRQPLILAAHHWDFAEGEGVAAEFARIVNSLPDVHWASPSEVARSCFQFRQAEELLHLKLDSRRVDVPPPEGAREVMIHRPWLRGSGEPELLTVCQGDLLLRLESSADVIGPIPLQGGSTLEISSSPLGSVDYRSVPPPRLRPWPLVRKLIMEVRDRSCVDLRLPGRSRTGELPAARRTAEECGGSR